MKKISNEEFEGLILDLINHKITRKELARMLEIDLRTLHKRIMEVSAINPELYEQYIGELAYKPKERTDIDFKALVIDIMKRK